MLLEIILGLSNKITKTEKEINYRNTEKTKKNYKSITKSLKLK